MRMEEEWMAVQGPSSEFSINVNSNALAASARMLPLNGGNFDDFSNPELTSVEGTQRDFVLGFFLGFVIGFFALFWVWMPYVSHRRKLGILSGIGMQVCLSLISADKNMAGGQQGASSSPNAF
tara:strand:+ start:595 stop:963 length:369 start_codon:yes stop_codon:yes gene_type:complete